MEISRKNKFYWVAQFTGWAGYLILAFFFNQIRGVPANAALLTSLITAFILGVGLSHAYRHYIVYNHWLDLSLIPIALRFVLGSAVIALVFEASYFGIIHLLLNSGASNLWQTFFQEWLSWYVVFTIWSLLYFLFHFFRNYKQEEIKNLKWEAASREMELNKLKSQLNPHFLFNALNTIRALVDENPKKAKKAIGQMSNVLRSSMVMHKKQSISFDEELQLVKDYLEIEKARYEDRLRVSFDIDPKSKEHNIPPLMLQTLVENGIKHGISHSTTGGDLAIRTSIASNKLNVIIENTGHYEPKKPLVSRNNGTGFGLQNTRERLHHLFGEEASFSIENINGQTVRTTLIIPKTISYGN